ncbi:MAG: hypothetical protein IPP63_03795 [Chloracidobacterium sp.]|nr:hypothetical protein [Chloracidobacterium sp.]
MGCLVQHARRTAIVQTHLQRRRREGDRHRLNVLTATCRLPERLGRRHQLFVPINYNGSRSHAVFSGKIKGDSMDGTVAFNENANEEWSAKRVPTPKPSMRKAEK